MNESTTDLHDALKYNLSFAGCGFLGIYHVGVAVCFRKYAPNLLLNKISGASAGSLASCCLLLDMPLGEMTSDFFRVVNEARSHSLGPFSPSFDIQTCILEGLKKTMPDDAHERVNGKLHISLTRVYDGKSIIVSQFNSKEDLIQALLCACFIPGFSGILPPKFHGIRYMDGAFSDNLPTLDENTVTVSPFAGETDICPRDDSAQIFHVNLSNTSIELSKQNIYRFLRILFPPSPEILSNMCQQGFDDALHFLHRNNLISCTRCLAIQSTFVLSQQTPEHFDPECTTCTVSREKLMKEKKMPEQVTSAMSKYLEESNSGILKWFRKPAVFVLKTLAMPATVPYDVVHATLTNYRYGMHEERRMKFCVHYLMKNAQCRKILKARMLACERLLATAPCVKKTIWGLTQFVMANLYQIFIPRFGYGNDEMVIDDEETKGSYSSIYDEDPLLKQFKHLEHRKSIMSLVDVEDSDFEVRGGMLSRRNSIRSGRTSVQPLMTSSLHSTDDTLDQVVNVFAANPDTSIYSYHYIDENDKTMKFNNILDVTDSELSFVQSHGERETNDMLQYDESDLDALHDTDYDHDLAIIHPQSTEIFDDWKCAEIKVDEIVSDPNGDDDELNSYKPEADQNIQLLSDDAIMAMRRHNSDYTLITRVDDE